MSARPSAVGQDLNRKASLQKRLRCVDALLAQRTLFDDTARYRFLQDEREWIAAQLRKLAA